LHHNNQLSAAEEAVSQALDLLSNKGEQFEVCQCYRLLGDICRSRGETEAAKNHFETALRIASSFGWHAQQFFILHSLAILFFDEGRFDDAQTHVERATYELLGAVQDLEACRRLLWTIGEKMKDPVTTG